MAGDGKIIVETGFDNSQAKKDAKEFENIAKDAAEGAASNGGKARLTLNTKEAERELKRVNKEIEEITEKKHNVEISARGQALKTEMEISKEALKNGTYTAAQYRGSVEQIGIKYADVVSKVNEYQGRLTELKGRQQELTSHIEQQAAAQQRVTAEQEATAQSANREAEAQARASVETERAARGSSRMRSMFDGIGRAASGLWYAVRRVGSGIRGFGSSLLAGVRYFKNMTRHADTLRKRVMRIGLALIGMRGIMAGVRQIVNQAMANNKELQTQLTAVKGILGEALAPAIKIVVAGLSQIITMADKIWQFFTGVSLIAQYNAKQAENMAQSTQDAADAAREYKNQLAGFDVANKLSDNSSSSSGGGSASTATQFSPAELSTWAQSFINKLKEAWASGDFTGLGESISDKIVTALQGINWDDISKKAAGVGKSFAQLINGLLKYSDDDGNTLATSLGKTVGGVINTGINLAWGFVTTLDWKNVGTSVYEFIVSTIKAIDWGKAGETIHGLITGLCDAIGSFFDNLHSGDAYETVSSAFTNFINGLQIGDIILNLAKVLLKILRVSIEWNTNIIDEIIKSLLEGFGFGQKGEMVEVDVWGIFKFHITTFEWFTPKEWAENVEKWLEENLHFNIDDLNLDMGANLGDVVGDMWGDKSDPNSLAGKFENVKRKMKETFSVDNLKELGSNILKGITDGFKNPFGSKNDPNSIAGKLNAMWGDEKSGTGLRGWFEKSGFNVLGKNLLNGILGGFKNPFGSKSDKNSIAGKLSAFWGDENKPNSLQGWFKASGFNSLGKNILTGITNGLGKIGEIWNNVYSRFKAFWESLSKYFSWSGFVQLGRNILKGIKEGLNNAWINITASGNDSEGRRLAAGGIVNNPGNGVAAIVGEAGPEAVIPLNKDVLGQLASLIGGGQSGNVIVPVYLDGHKLATYTIDTTRKLAFEQNVGGAY